MANVANIPDSHKPLVHEIIFAVGQRGKNLRLFGIPSHEFLRSINVDLTSRSAWTGQIVLFDQDGDFIENLVLLAGRSRRILFRWGWDDGRSLEDYPMYEGAITSYTPDFTPEGVTLTLDIVSSTVIEQVLSKRTRSFKEGKLCSDIVREIADDKRNKWIHTIGGADTIETTDTKLAKPISSKDESDLKFLRDKVVKEAVNKDQKAIHFFFDRDNVLHFHSEFFIIKQDQNKKFAATYRFARDAMGEVLSFRPTDTSIFKSLLGGANADFDAIDSLAGNRLLIKSTQTGGLPNSRNEVGRDAAFQTPLFGETQSKINLIARDPRELERIAAHRHSVLRETTYTANLQVLGTHAVRLMSHIIVDYIKRDGRSHYLSGEFRVHTVSHTVDSSGWVTDMTLARSGTRSPTDVPGFGVPRQEISQEIAGKETRDTQGAGISAGRRKRAGDIKSRAVRS